ncbi:MAG: EamA family transporter RarD [Phycisphaerae bacterium]
MNTTAAEQSLNPAVGVVCGVGAFLAWGFVPVYFKAVGQVSPLEIVGHRVVWSFLLLSLLVTALGRKSAFAATLANARLRYLLMMTTTLIATNWLLYIWAVTNHFVVEASIGYFINPLVNVLLGMVFLRERLRPLQGVSVALAFVAVVALTVVRGALPWIPLGLAFTFGFYGLVRKISRVDGLIGLTVETAFLSGTALIGLIYAASTQLLIFGASTRTLDFLLVGSGIVTIVPLLLFGAAARRVSLTAIGFMQYIAPTIQMLIGLAYGETLSGAEWNCLIVIWLALAIFTFDGYRRIRNRSNFAPPPPTHTQAANAATRVK